MGRTPSYAPDLRVGAVTFTRHGGRRGEVDAPWGLIANKPSGHSLPAYIYPLESDPAIPAVQMEKACPKAGCSQNWPPYKMTAEKRGGNGLDCVRRRVLFRVEALLRGDGGDP